MKMGYILGAVVVVSGGVALFGSGFRDSRPAPEPPAAQPAAAIPAVPDEQPAADMQVIEGQVLETLEVASYTYLRIGAPGSEGQWAAVSTAQVKVGDQVRVRSGTKMVDFESPTLKRKFASIYFGSLDDGTAPTAGGPLPAGHPPAAAASGMPAGMPAGHPAASAAPELLQIGKLDKATGPNGRTIAEVFAQLKALSGQKVRVRGVVVKATNGIMGKNFIHLRDGSGTDQAKNNDLVVTTVEELVRNQTVMLEGTLVLDKDLGAGYRYDALLEDAATVR